MVNAGKGLGVTQSGHWAIHTHSPSCGYLEPEWVCDSVTMLRCQVLPLGVHFKGMTVASLYRK